jgi:hypothetical protein
MEDLQESWVPSLFLWLGILICVDMLLLLWPYRHYYFLAPSLRPLDPHYGFLRSSGIAGLSSGAIGTLLIFVNLTYLIRKRLITIVWLGSLRSWMAFHVFSGLLAGAMVLLHSALLLRSALGILAFSSISIVILTGLVGRYIYARTPRSVRGRELELDEIRRDLADYQERLEKMGMPHEFFERSVAQPVVHGSDKGLLETLVGLAAGDWELRREYKNLRKMVQELPAVRPLAREVLPLAARYCEERHWVARYQELRSLMGGWRFFHRWFAILLMAAVCFHILVAYQMGNLHLVDSLKAFFHRL